MLTNPVGIWQIDAYGSGGVAVAAEHYGVDHLHGDSADLALAVGGIDRRMILEPLGIGRDDLSPFGSLVILDVYVSFPGALSTERVIVVFYETVHKIHCAIQFLNPGDVILIPFAKVSAAVIL